MTYPFTLLLAANRASLDGLHHLAAALVEIYRRETSTVTITNKDHKTMSTPKIPKCPIEGWRWAAGLKPHKDDKFWSRLDGLLPLNHADMTYHVFPDPRQGEYDEWGYIRRIARKGGKGAK